MKITGLYIHIPFCHARCGYCDFTTFTGKESQIDAYVDALCQEIPLYPSTPLQTIFFGGGTPSLLEPHHAQQILTAVQKHFTLSDHAEVTLEANPESITLDKAKGWKTFGINRLSLGLQVMDDTLLKTIDRLHTVEDFLAAYRNVREAGFDNVSVDLIYGLPSQSLVTWQETVKKTVALQPDHLSLYALKVEDHTPFRAQDIKIQDDLQAEMYEWSRGFLKEAGYEQYEISNFAKPGKECRHNLIYWRQQDYIGIGVGAVGGVGGVRWNNSKTLSDYFALIKEGKLPRLSVEHLDESTRKFESLMLGLRLREGLEWGKESNPEWIAHRSKLQAEKLLEEVSPGRWRIPDHAIALTNQILLPFV